MSATIGGGRYDRIPTRFRLHFAWVAMGTGLFVWEFLKLTLFRVRPKREEQTYTLLREQYGENIPAHVLDQVQALREMREGLSLHAALATPAPGQFTNIVAKDFDYRRLGELRK